MTIQTRAEFYGAKPREMRATFGIQSRAEDDGIVTVEGYASISDTPYDVQDWLGSYAETVSRGAFAKTLREADDVRWLVNHGGIALARTKSGTLILREIINPADDPQGKGQTGLWSTARLDTANPEARSIASAIERGDVDQMSFAFLATRQEWNADYTERTILEAKLFDVSAVTYPANPATSIGVEGERAEDPAAAYEAGHHRYSPEPDAARRLAYARASALA